MIVDTLTPTPLCYTGPDFPFCTLSGLSSATISFTALCSVCSAEGLTFTLLKWSLAEGMMQMFDQWTAVEGREDLITFDYSDRKRHSE